MTVHTPSTAPASSSREQAHLRPKARVLCVDDEPLMLESLRDSLRRRFEVVATTSGFEALRLLTDQPFQVVVSDMRMPLLDGARFLTLARQHAPETVRLLLTGQSTVDDAVAAINDGEIFRFLVKPCAMPELISALDSAVTRHQTLVCERQLSEETLQGTLRALTGLAAAVDPDAPARARRLRGQAEELAAAAEATALAWELERACELMQLGVVGLSPETRARLSSGRRLTRDQVAELEDLPEHAARFVAPIPRLAPVAALLSAVARPLVPTRPGVAGTLPAARVLRIVLDFDLLETQGVSTTTALQTLQARSDRYDRSLLETFAALQRLS